MTPKSTELVSVAASLPAMSQDEMVETIKQTVAKGATDAELQMFLAVCKRYELDPFAKEVFFIKEKPSEPGRIQAGRDAYLAIANRHPAYEGMTSDVVYAGDTFRRTEAGVDHQYDFASRKGTIIGAYAIVYRSDRRIPSYSFARFSEYAPAEPKGWSPWHKFPSAMIQKVAETAALKKAFSISGLTPIGISEPDDDYVDTAPVAPARAQIPFAQAVGPYAPSSDDDIHDLDGPTGPVESPRPVGGLPDDDESPSSSALGGEHVLSAKEWEEMGQTRIDEDEIPG